MSAQSVRIHLRQMYVENAKCNAALLPTDAETDLLTTFSLTSLDES